MSASKPTPTITVTRYFNSENQHNSQGNRRSHEDPPVVRRRREVAWLPSHVLEEEPFGVAASAPVTPTGSRRISVDYGTAGLGQFQYPGDVSASSPYSAGIPGDSGTLPGGAYRRRYLSGLEQSSLNATSPISSTSPATLHNRRVMGKRWAKLTNKTTATTAACSCGVGNVSDMNQEITAADHNTSDTVEDCDLPTPTRRSSAPMYNVKRQFVVPQHQMTMKSSSASSATDFIPLTPKVMVRSLSRPPLFNASLTPVREMRCSADTDQQKQSHLTTNNSASSSVQPVGNGRDFLSLPPTSRLAMMRFAGLSSSSKRTNEAWQGSEDTIQQVEAINNKLGETALVNVDSQTQPSSPTPAGRHKYRKHSATCSPGHSTSLAAEGRRFRKKSDDSHRISPPPSCTSPQDPSQLLFFSDAPEELLATTPQTPSSPSARSPSSSGKVRRISTPVAPSVSCPVHHRSISVTERPPDLNHLQSSLTPNVNSSHPHSASTMFKSMFSWNRSKPDTKYKTLDTSGQSQGDTMTLCTDCALSMSQGGVTSNETRLVSPDPMAMSSNSELHPLKLSNGNLVCHICHKNISLKPSQEKAKFMARFRSISISGGRPTVGGSRTAHDGKSEPIAALTPPTDPSKLPKSVPYSESLSFSPNLLLGRKKTGPNRKISLPAPPPGHRIVSTRPTASSVKGYATPTTTEAASPTSGQCPHHHHHSKSAENLLNAVLPTAEDYIMQRLFHQIRQESQSPLPPGRERVGLELSKVSVNDRFVFLTRKSTSVNVPTSAPTSPLENRSVTFDENELFAAFFLHSTAYDVIPASGKLVVLDSKLALWRAFRALMYNGVHAAPVWSSKRQMYVGVLTMSDFVHILHLLHTALETTKCTLNELEAKSISYWAKFLQKAGVEPAPLHRCDSEFPHSAPETELSHVVGYMHKHGLHLLPVMDTARGNILALLSSKRIFRYLHLKRQTILVPSWDHRCAAAPPKPRWLMASIESAGLWRKDASVGVLALEDSVQRAMEIFVQTGQHALPVIDPSRQGALIDIYTQSDTLNLASDEAYPDLRFSVRKALVYKQHHSTLHTVVTTVRSSTVEQLMDIFGANEVQSVVVVDDAHPPRPVGIIDVHDLLNYLILKETRPSSVDHSNVGS